MAGNTGNGSRVGVVKNRKQTYNSKTKKFVKLDTKTGKIIKCKDTPFKSVRKDGNAKNASSKLGNKK